LSFLEQAPVAAVVEHADSRADAGAPRHPIRSAMRLRPRRVSFFSALLVILAACSAKHAPVPAAAGERVEAVADSKPCDRSDQDSSRATHLPLYRECAVEVKARPRGTGARPDFTPTKTDGGCYFVAIELVVGISGQPEIGTARVLRTNDAIFANAVLSTVPTLGFTPAKIGGVAVRQIFELSMAMTTYTSRSASSAGGSSAPLPGRRPPCATRR
jgi:hypothetical protein